MAKRMRRMRRKGIEGRLGPLLHKIVKVVIRRDKKVKREGRRLERLMSSIFAKLFKDPHCERKIRAYCVVVKGQQSGVRTTQLCRNCRTSGIGSRPHASNLPIARYTLQNSPNIPCPLVLLGIRP